jgi:hypothetical protein
MIKPLLENEATANFDRFHVYDSLGNQYAVSA